MKKIILLLLTGLLCSCATQIVRWSDKSDEMSSRSLPCESNQDVFHDFLWTTPPLTARKIDSDFIFADEEYTLKATENGVIVTKEGREHSFVFIESDKDKYPDTSYLKPTTKIVHKWVPRTTTRMESVPVTKTRTVPVTTYGANGASSTSYKTEVYTDFEHRTITETDWVWESHSEPTYKVPSFHYCDIEMDGETLFWIYKIDDQYYLQNPNYLMCTETNESFWGDKEVNIIFVDSNGNGVFFEDEDHVLFNTWNPYDPESKYSEISYLMDNKWYYADILKKELFLDFIPTEGKIEFSYLNERFMDTNGQGTLTINGIDGHKSLININGKKYKIRDGKPFKSEYGFFNLKISIPHHLDYEEIYTIDETEPNKVIDYSLTDEAVLLEIKNIFAKNYFVTVKTGDDERTFYNMKKMNIPLGESTVEISVNGFTFVKKIDSLTTGEVSIDFEEEIKNL